MIKKEFIKGIDYFLTKGMTEGLTWLAPLVYMADTSFNLDVYFKDPKYVSQPGITFLDDTKPIDVKHLVYVAQHITYTELNNLNSIVSGAFSGCWMGRYYDGVKFNVCHIDTADSHLMREIFLTNKEHKEKCYFLPAKIILDPSHNTTIEEMCQIHKYKVHCARDVFGVITSDNQFYSFIMGIYKGDYHVVAWAEWEIHDKKQILKRCLTQFEELYPHMIDPDSVISLVI